MNIEEQKQTRDIIVAFRITFNEACHIDFAGASLKSPRGRADFCRSASLHYAKQRVPPPAKPVALPNRRKPTHDIVVLSRLLAEVGRLGTDTSEMATLARLRGALPNVDELRTIAEHLEHVRHQLVIALGGTADEVPQ